jgi:hypothetical protein
MGGTRAEVEVHPPSEESPPDAAPPPGSAGAIFPMVMEGQAHCWHWCPHMPLLLRAQACLLLGSPLVSLEDGVLGSLWTLLAPADPSRCSDTSMRLPDATVSRHIQTVWCGCVPICSWPFLSSGHEFLEIFIIFFETGAHYVASFSFIPCSLYLNT